MFCEHPRCTLEAHTICKYHCYLSVCEQHRIEHETKLLNEFEKQLNDLSNPISTLLNQSQCNLKQSQISRQRELDQMNSLFDRHLSSIDQRLKFSRTTNEFILNKREQLIKYQNGDHQLTKEDYQQIQNLSNQIQNNLQQQYQLNNQIRDKNTSIHSWPINQDNNVSTEIECIELSDSDDEVLQNSIEQQAVLSSPDSHNQIEGGKKQRESNLFLIRDFCPLTQLGIFGLNSSHNLPRLCSKKNNKRVCLYHHFTHYHCLRSSVACQLLKAIRNGCNPNETKIFPKDNTTVSIENIQCPFDSTAIKFSQKNFIPNTPCYSSLAYHYFKNHLRTVHCITKVNADLIYHAMKDYGTISHVQFEEDLCEME